MTKKQTMVMECRLQGMCCVEISAKLGIANRNVRRIVERIGMPFTDEEKQRSLQLGAEKSILHQYGTLEDRNQHNAEYVEQHHPTFIWLDGMVAGNNSVKLQCKECGTKIIRSANTVRGIKNLRCPYCYEKQREQKRIEAEQIKKAERKYKEHQRYLKKSFKQMAFSFCPICDSVFYGNRKYCSDDCAKKYFNATHKDKRVRKIKYAKIDTDINVQKLYERDNGICWICGDKCDWNDHYLNDNGVFIVGYNYPSIDHVYPLSKGGLHSWDNVKLAHHYCNSLKKDKVVSA